MTSMTQDVKNISNFLDNFVVLVIFELISHYPKIDNAQWLTREMQRTMDRVFWEKLMVQMALNLSSLTFLLNIWFLSDFVVAFIVFGLIVMSYWLHMHENHSCAPIEAYLSVFVDFRWKLLNLTAVKTLKIIIRNIFWTLANLKLIIVNCKSVTVMTAVSSFLLQPNLFWLVTLSFNYCLYDINVKRFQKYFKSFWIFSKYWLILNSYHIIQVLIAPIGSGSQIKV